jgi:glutamyl/glutaminyl-tRNA synthetase
VTKQDNTIEMASLESCIREDLNENAPRAMAVIDPVKLVIENYPQGASEMVSMPNHPNKPEMGSRDVPFSVKSGSIAPTSVRKPTSSTSVWCWVKKFVCVTPM